jgi:hypothetical protein
MQANGPVPNNNDNPGQPGLPPVKPPSGRFILQLFLIPGLIVAGLVIVFVFGGLAWVGSSSPQSLLTKLDSDNPDIRWRAAQDLAQLLLRPESLELASDPKFGLDLVERQDQALAELEQAENATKEGLKKTLAQIHADSSLNSEQKEKRSKEAQAAAWRKLAPQSDLVLFLTMSLGALTLPVGAPVLCDTAMKDHSPEVIGLALRRRQAVWALTKLGEKMQRHYFGKNTKPDDKVLTLDQKARIIAQLEKEAAGTGKRAYWAGYALGVVQNKRPAGVDIALEICVRGNDKIKPADDPSLREYVAGALLFWDGDRVEPTLLWLSRDDGHGKRIVE